MDNRQFEKRLEELNLSTSKEGKETNMLLIRQDHTVTCPISLKGHEIQLVTTKIVWFVKVLQMHFNPPFHAYVPLKAIAATKVFVLERVIYSTLQGSKAVNSNL